MILKLNEYVRTKYGNIVKVVGVQSGGIEKYYFDKKVIDNFKELTQIGTENVVLKHSFNIIDLIEEGDYVNDKKVKINYKDAILFEDDSDIVEQQIRKIVTHEQMEAMEYEVK